MHVLTSISFGDDVDETDAAQGVHRLILLHGHTRAREIVDAKMRLLVDIAAEVMADEQQRIGIWYTGFCLTALPHKRLEDSTPWEKKGPPGHPPCRTGSIKDRWAN